MYYIGLDVHKKTISYCVKDAAGHVHREGKIGSTRRELDAWIKMLPQPRIMAIRAEFGVSLPIHAGTGSMTFRFAGRSANRIPPTTRNAITSVKFLWTP